MDFVFGLVILGLVIGTLMGSGCRMERKRERTFTDLRIKGRREVTNA